MKPIERISLRAQKETVRAVVLRHGTGCAHCGDPAYRSCECLKYIYMCKGARTRPRLPPWIGGAHGWRDFA
jgi:hypothetical protein